MDHNQLLAEVAYDPATGIFRRKISKGNSKAGSIVGGQDKKGYLKALVLGEYVKMHRLPWFYVYGVWPEQVDHINGIKTDNRIQNLRECSTQENCLNQHGPRKNNRTGARGVHQIPKTGKWRAVVSVLGVRTHLGMFSSKEEAQKAYETFRSPYLP